MPNHAPIGNSLYRNAHAKCSENQSAGSPARKNSKTPNNRALLSTVWATDLMEDPVLLRQTGVLREKVVLRCLRSDSVSVLAAVANGREHYISANIYSHKHPVQSWLFR